MYAMESILHAEEYTGKRESSEISAPAVMTFFSALVRTETRLYNALNENLRANHGLATSQFEALAYIAKNPDTRVAEFARAFAIGIGATSKVVDRLQNSGWVERVENSQDRRSSFLRLTAAGHTLLTEAEATFQAQLLAILAGAGIQAEFAAGVKLLEQIQSHLEEKNLGTPAG